MLWHTGKPGQSALCDLIAQFLPTPSTLAPQVYSDLPDMLWAFPLTVPSAWIVHPTWPPGSIPHLLLIFVPVASSWRPFWHLDLKHCPSPTWPGTPNFPALLPLPPPWSSSPSNTNHSLYLVFIFYFPHWTVRTKSAGGFVCLVHWCSINTFDQIKAWTYSFRFPLSFSAPVQREKPYCCPFSILTWIHQKKLLMLVCVMIQMMPESCNHYIRLFRR